MVTKTSLLAYAEALENLGDHQLQVYKTLRKLGEANNQMIARKLEWGINSVTPRMKELRDLKLATFSKEAPDLVTGRKTIYWRAISK